MTYETYNEDRVFHAELNVHLAKEDREVRRAEAIEQYADGLLQEDAEYYPLDPCNFSEVLAELKDDQVEVIAYYLKTTQREGFSFQMNNEMVCRMLWVFAEKYMRECAEQRAEKELE